MLDNEREAFSEALPEAASCTPSAGLELALAPEEVPGLLRRAPGSRPRSAGLVWHDTAAGELTAAGLALCGEAGAWRLERLRPEPAHPWPPGAPPPVLARGEGPDALGLRLSGPLTPIAAWQGTRRVLQVASGDGAVLEAELLDGRLHSVASEAPLCRLLLRGPPDALGLAAVELARSVRLGVPLDSIAVEAIRFARGIAPAPRLGGPDVPAGVSLTDAIAAVLGHLTAVLLHWSGPAGERPEAVHQMRVATRRLRSALSVFRTPAACQEIEALQPALRDLAARLGAARDWDVFLDGTGREALDAVAGDSRVAATLAAARRRRHAAYGELREMLAGPGWRELQVALACAAASRPWERAADGERLDALRQPLAEHGAIVLTRRRKRVRKGAKGLRTMPIEALHELRKSCKKLRYAAEIMRSQFPGGQLHRFDKRLSALQEALGTLNDGAVARGLMAELGRSGRGFGAGVVTGYAAAQSGDARRGIRHAWRRFRDVPAFWRQSLSR